MSEATHKTTPPSEWTATMWRKHAEAQASAMDAIAEQLYRVREKGRVTLRHVVSEPTPIPVCERCKTLGDYDHDCPDVGGIACHLPF